MRDADVYKWEPDKEFGFYNGGKVVIGGVRDPKGLGIHEPVTGRAIYLDYREAQSMASLLTKILWKVPRKLAKKKLKVVQSVAACSTSTSNRRLTGGKKPKTGR